MKKQIKLLVVVSIFVGIISFVSCFDRGMNSGVNTSNNQSTYDKVIQSKTIRVGYIPYPPGLVKDPNTKQLSGIFHDVLVEAGRNLELKIEFTEELNFGSMIEAIKSNRVDMVCTAVWANSQRGKQVDFTTPLYFSPVKAYVKDGNTKFDSNIAGLNSSGVTISTLDGEMTSIIAKFDFPNATVASMPQNTDVSQLLLNVADGKADVTFVEPVVANEFIKNNPGKVKEISNVKALRIFPNVMMVGDGETKFLSMMNSALEELQNNGFVDKVIDKYEPYPNSFYRVAVPYKEQTKP